MPLLGMRLIDLAIFGTLGSLWVGGAFFLYFLYRWVIRFERDGGSPPAQLEPEPVAPSVHPESARPQARPRKSLVPAHP